MTVAFDNELFAKKLYDALWEKRLHYRDVAEQVGISSATVCRIVTHRKRPDADSLAKLLDWLKADFKDFIKIEVEGPIPPR
jgi:transcriptional regulator with XRE-family HTH domain